jgi:predicted negative regulator of RcsB-dependent stress response
MILVVLLAKVQLHAGAFEHALRLAGSVVDERWDAAVGW